MNNSSHAVEELSGEKRNALESLLLEKLAAAQNKRTRTTNNGVCNALSFAQEGLWFLEQLKPNTAIYNIAQGFRLSGPVDGNVLARAFDTVVQRHQVLRTNFIATAGKPVQSIRPTTTFVLKQVNLENRNDGETEAQQLLNQEAQTPFNLERDPLLRATLVRLSSTEHFLLIVIHHIIADFSSLEVLYRELSECYNAALAGKEATLPELKVQFSEWASTQRTRLQGDTWDRKSNYWKQKLSGELPVMELPTAYARAPQQSFAGAKHDLTLPGDLLNQLKELSRREGTTLYLTLLTAFSVLVQRYSGQREFIIGSPIDQRNTSDAEKLIGYFINTLPLRLTFPENCTFAQALQQVRSVALDTFVNQEMPFEKIVESLQLPRSTDRNPIFQVVFQYLPKLPMPAFQGISAASASVHTGTSKFDLTFTVAETANGLAGELEYNSDLFEAATIQRLAAHYETLLRSAIRSPLQKISDLSILSEKEQQQILLEWNDTTTKYPRDSCVHDLFEEESNRHPDTTALNFEGRTMSYGELNKRANQLANYLKNLGVGPDVLVGLALERSFEMVIAVLGILKAGGAYVPLDPVYPRERLNYIIADTGIAVLVTTSQFKDLGENVAKTIVLDTETDLLDRQKTTTPLSQTTSESAAYVMYTSGSTGKPKGVLVPHRGIVRLVRETNYVQFSSNDVFLQFAPISFDASTFEIWGALLNGARLVIYPRQMASLEEFGHFVLKEGITTLWLTAGLFHQVVDQHVDTLRGLKRLLAGGDVLSVPQVTKALRELPNCQLINGYGPTENTTFTCCYTVPHDWNGTSLPIGKPISNTQVYILDEALKPVPIGVPGELYIGGDGLAREYLRAPELNVQKFIPNPFSSDSKSRLYKTGDRVRWMSGGTIEFLGRFDNQVKVRGFRIELGEVEIALAQYPQVKETAVVARQNCIGKELVAYVVPNDHHQIDFGTVRQFLQQRLPLYMIPAHFVALEKFPLNANGKIDRHKLPAPGENSSPCEARIAPRNALEERLHEIWTEVLAQKQISMEDNFFEMGGHSLIATQIISRTSAAFAQDVPLRLLFEFPTIASFGEAICRHRGEAASEQGPIRKRTRANPVRLDQLSDSQIETLFQSSQQKIQ